MSTSNNFLHLPPPPEYPSTSTSTSAATSTTIGDPLANLSAIRNRVDSLSHLLSTSVNANAPLPKHDSDAISAELISAVHHIIINGAALITPTPPQPQNPTSKTTSHDHHHHHNNNHINNNNNENENENDFEIIELDAVDLTIDNNSHTCHICSKTFKRDANLRMHMRAHGDQFKTLESLSKRPPPPGRIINNINLGSATGSKRTRFSCPNIDCNRNKNHKDFRPLKSVICVKNHFKRSHCPKKYCCTRCKIKSFSVLSDLKSHMKQCAVIIEECDEIKKWKCSCQMMFSTKSELFGHMSVFDGHMPDYGSGLMMNEEDDDDDGFGGLNIEDDQQFDLWSSIEELIRF